jgi:hypothetical protein
MGNQYRKTTCPGLPVNCQAENGRTSAAFELYAGTVNFVFVKLEPGSA